MPASDAQIMVGDIGTVFKVTVKDEEDAVVDVSAATTKQLIFRKPDGTILTKTASFTNSGTDGIIQWTAVSGDLDQRGVYRIQAYIVVGATYFHSNVGTFQVYPNLA